MGDIVAYVGVAYVVIAGMRSGRRQRCLERQRGHGAGSRPRGLSNVTGAAPAPRSRGLRAMELAVVLPLLGWLWVSFIRDPDLFLDWRLLVWIGAIAIVDLLPVEGSADTSFSLSFPIELSAALVYPPPVVALITLLGAADMRELKGEIPPLKALYNRGQIAWSVALESLVFHQFGELGGGVADVQWWVVIPAVLAAALAGYMLNVLIVALYSRVQIKEPIAAIIRQMHVGIFGEFVLCYMGLALFSVLVATSTEKIGILWRSSCSSLRSPSPDRCSPERIRCRKRRTSSRRSRPRTSTRRCTTRSPGCPTGCCFQQRLAAAIEDARDNGGSIAVMLMDLDHFKEVNDTLGHHFGDQLLKEIGPRLSTVLRDDDMMARLGGDEFGVLLPELPDDEVAFSIAGRLLEELDDPGLGRGTRPRRRRAASASRSIPTQSRNAESLLRRADVAMYSAKEAGGGYEVYQPEMDQHNPARLTLVSQVRPAIENGEFAMYYQPKVRLQRRAGRGCRGARPLEPPRARVDRLPTSSSRSSRRPCCCAR